MPQTSARPPESIERSEIRLRKPSAVDGRAVHELIAQCPPLDRNSVYCNLLQCTHFAQTCVLAEQDGAVVGFISGYRLPDRTATLFIWQVAVCAQARGLGLARRMLMDLLERPHCADIDTVETTITPDNRASWSLFESLARALEAPLRHRTLFDRQRHFQGDHDTEILVTIGPFAAPTERPAAQRRRTA